MQKVEAIVVAAGQGRRMGTTVRKTWLPIQGTPILMRTLQRLSTTTTLERIIVVVSAEDLAQTVQMIQDAQLSCPIVAVAGGDERQDSVRCGLRALDESTGFVLIHDGARPFIQQQEIEACIREAITHGAAVLAVPVKDTIKRVQHSTVVATLDRSELYAVQTPQVFGRQIIEEAHRHAQMNHLVATDDASLVEAMGLPVRMVQGSYFNIKITTPEDLVIAECIELQQGGTYES